jgi:hypothetical protein
MDHGNTDGRHQCQLFDADIHATGVRLIKLAVIKQAEYVV